MEKRQLKEGDVVQLNPDHKFGGMIVVVTEPKEWGCQGYLMSEYNFEAVRFQGKAFVRPTFADFEYVGTVQWINDSNVESQDECKET